MYMYALIFAALDLKSYLVAVSVGTIFWFVLQLLRMNQTFSSGLYMYSSAELAFPNVLVGFSLEIYLCNHK